MSQRWMLRGLRWSYCVFIAAASITTAESALGGQGEGSASPQIILALASIEAFAALALAIEPVELVACSALLLVYSIAGVVSALSADWEAVLRFVFYAATAIYIVLASRASRGPRTGIMKRSTASRTWA
jgi:hypothetical protein